MHSLMMHCEFSVQQAPDTLSQQSLLIGSQLPTAQSAVLSHGPPAALFGAHFLLMHTFSPEQSLAVAQSGLHAVAPQAYAPQLTLESASFTQAKLLHFWL
jgi:hypothetical protein